MSNNLINMSENMSKRINCIRFLLALCVVFIHNDMRNITYMGNKLNLSYGISLMYSISDSITMVAVPLFFFLCWIFCVFKII